MFTQIILLLFYAIGRIDGDATVVNKVYQGLIIHVDNELSPGGCGNLITRLKNNFKKANSVLKESTGLRFGKILVIIPKQWEDCGTHYISEIKGHLTKDRADFRVGPSHPVFGNLPWTDQFRTCGLPGNYIYVPVDFLKLNSSSANILVHEWAKYRWGVFEEYGITDDEIFPSHFPTEKDGNQPNLCTNRNVAGFDDCDVDESCRYKYERDNNRLISSSLMAVPEIQNAKSFCTDRSHKRKFPNKQNLLCDGVSTWDIIQKHTDFTDMRSGYDDEDVLDFKIARESDDYVLVIAAENTASTNEATNRLTFIKESVTQFIKYEIPDSFRVGFVEFADVTEKRVQLTPLDSKGRNFLKKEIMNMKISKENDKNILRAIEVSTEIIGEGVGNIMLITSCPDRIDYFELGQMVSAANGNQVWVILYPYDKCQSSEILSKLASRTNGQIIYIKDDVLPAQHPYVSPTIRMILSQSYRTFLHSEANFYIQQIQKEKCKEMEVWCKRDIPIIEDFNRLHYLYFYHDYKEHVFASSEVVVHGNGACNLIEMSRMVRGTKIFECNLKKGSKVSISIERDRPSDLLIFELVGSPSRSKSDYSMNIWFSDSFQNLTYSENSIPAIYAELTYEKRRILNANLTLQIEAENIASNHYSYATLNDKGIGADITGNDGIYSTHLLPIPLDRTVLLSIFSNNDDGNSMIWPNYYDQKNQEKIICCGSKLSTNRNEGHNRKFSKSLCNIPVTIHVSSSYIRIAPSQIRDLIATQKGGDIKLTFTSPGNDLDHGTANFYSLTVYENNLERESFTEKIDIKPKVSGSMEIVKVEINNCSSTYGFRVAASDDKLNKAKESNLAIISTVCETKTNKVRMSGGSIAGIVIIVILIILLLILLFYLQKRRKIRKQQEFRNIMRDQSNGPLIIEGLESLNSEIFPLSHSVRSTENLTVSKIEKNMHLQRSIEDSPSTGRSLDNLEVNELVRQSLIKQNNFRELPPIPKSNLVNQSINNTSNPNIIGIPLLLDEAIAYKRKKMENRNEVTDAINIVPIEYPHSASSSSSEGTEI